MRVVLQAAITNGVSLCQKRRLQKQFRVNRRSIIWLASRRQGRYENGSNNLHSPFRSSCDNASLRREWRLRLHAVVSIFGSFRHESLPPNNCITALSRFSCVPFKE